MNYSIHIFDCFTLFSRVLTIKQYCLKEKNFVVYTTNFTRSVCFLSIVTWLLFRHKKKKTSTYHFNTCYNVTYTRARAFVIPFIRDSRILLVSAAAAGGRKRRRKKLIISIDHPIDNPFVSYTDHRSNRIDRLDHTPNFTLLRQYWHPRRPRRRRRHT